MEYIIEMLNITKEFPGIIANDNITLQLKKGEIHSLLGENGAGKSTLMSVLFGMYKPEKGTIKKNGKEVHINDPNDANALGIGMVHQHFKLVENFTVTENIILGVENTKYGFLDRKNARKRIVDLSKKYGLKVDPDAKIEDISVGMQQRVEILKMLYRNNEILIFDEPTAVLTPQEIEELMDIMRSLAKEGKSILFITHKLNEIMAVSDRCTVLRKGKYMGTVNIKDTNKSELSKMMVGREIDFDIEKNALQTGETVLKIENMTVASKVHKNYAVKDVSLEVKRGEIVTVVGIEGNGQSEFVYALTGIEKLVQKKEKTEDKNESKKIDFKEILNKSKVFFKNISKNIKSVFSYKKNSDNTSIKGKIILCGKDITRDSIRNRSKIGMSHIPEDRHKYGLVLDYTLAENMVLQRYWEKTFQKGGFIINKAVNAYSKKLIEKYDVRSGQGNKSIVRSMSGGNQQKAILAREIDKNPELLVAVQPTRGLDVGAIEYIHKQLLAHRDSGKAVLLISFELEEVLKLSDRIYVMYEGEIVAELEPKNITREELGLYMAGAKRQKQFDKNSKEVAND